MEICKKIFLAIFFLFIFQNGVAGVSFKDLKDNRKISYLDFVLLKIEQRLIQRHRLMGPQQIVSRVQYQNIITQVEFLEKDSKIMVSIIGVMDKRRYKKKKYKPKLTDCNILRNVLLYDKYGYNVFLGKRNKHLTEEDMRNLFEDRFLNNLSLSKEEKNFIINNTKVKSQIIDPVRGNDIFCSGAITKDLE